MKFVMILCCTFALSGYTVSAQNGTAAAASLTSAEHISTLANGTLLIRLPSNRKKIQAIETSLESEQLADKARTRLELLLAETHQETEEMHLEYIAAFESEYSFSDYGFFLDYNTPGVLEGWSPILQSDLESEKEMMNDKPWYILSIGRTPDSRLDGLVIFDHKLDLVPRPFPNNVITSGFAAFKAWFSSEPAAHLHVRKLQKNLERFAQRAQ